MDFCEGCGILLTSPSGEPVPYCGPCKRANAAREECLASSKGAVGHDPSHDEAAQSTASVKKGQQSQNTKVKGKTSSKKSRDQDKVEDSLSSSDDDWEVVKSKSKSDKYSMKKEREPWENQVAEEVREKWTKLQAEYKTQLSEQDTADISALVGGQRRKTDGSRYYIGGVDISFIKGNDVDACACLTVIQMPNLEMVYQRMEMIKLTQPYIPGFLAFREVPALEELFQKLKKSAPQYTPDVIFVDGNGTLHPKGVGLACQLGVILDVPTVGVAKNLMTAQGNQDDDAHKKKKLDLKEAGDGFKLISVETGRTIGMCLRAHDNAKNPVYVSIGHKISLDSAVWIVLECSKYRIPEPVRRADLDSREYLRQEKKEPFEFIK